MVSGEGKGGSFYDRCERPREFIDVSRPSCFEVLITQSSFPKGRPRWACTVAAAFARRRSTYLAPVGKNLSIFVKKDSQPFFPGRRSFVHHSGLVTG